MSHTERHGPPVVFRHKGERYVGEVVKQQRRCVSIRDGRGRLLLVPRTAIEGPA